MKYIDPKTTLSRGFIFIDSTTQTNKQTEIQTIITFLLYLEKKGYLLSENLIKSFLSIDEDLFIKLSKDIKLFLKPKKVIFLKESFATKNKIINEKYTYEDGINQIVQYFNTYGLEIVDEEFFKIKHRDNINVTKENNIKFKILDVKNVVSMKSYIDEVMNMPIVFGSEQKILLNEAFENDLIDFSIVEGKIKENMIFIVSLLEKGDFNIDNLKLVIKTPTDLLRYCYHLSGEDYSNLNDTNIIFSLTTSEKKRVLKVLENILINTKNWEEFYSKRSHWIRLMNHIVPLSKKYIKYTECIKFFNEIYKTNKFIGSFNSKKELYMKENIDKLIIHLSKRPGELLRSLDFIIRTGTDSNILLLEKTLADIKLNSKLIIQVYKWLEYRANFEIKERIFNISGLLFKASCSINERPSLSKLSNKKVNLINDVLRMVLNNNLKGKELIDMNKTVYLDPELKNYILPYELRNNSISLSGSIYTPGTRIKLPDNVNFLRLFTSWACKEGTSANFDIDLSAGIVKGDEVLELTFYNQNEDMAIHSGDFTSCTSINDSKMVGEFVDFDIQGLCNLGYEYILTSSNIYSSADLSDDMITDVEVYSGYKIIESRKEDSNFIKIKDVDFELLLKGSGQTHMSIALDLKTKEIVIIDKFFNSSNADTLMDLRRNLETYKSNYFEAINSKENLYDFLKMYCDANNIKTTNKLNFSDIVFTYNDSISKKEIFNVSNNLEKIITLLK